MKDLYVIILHVQICRGYVMEHRSVQTTMTRAGAANSSVCLLGCAFRTWPCVTDMRTVQTAVTKLLQNVLEVRALYM
jgi:hypothetical protein